MTVGDICRQSFYIYIGVLTVFFYKQFQTKYLYPGNIDFIFLPGYNS